MGAAIDLGAYEYSNNNLFISLAVGSGSGTVISHPAAIDCGPGSTDCFDIFPQHNCQPRNYSRCGRLDILCLGLGC